VNSLIANLGKTHGLERVITYSSKSPRPGEIDGVDYHFVTPQEFEQKIAQGFFLEWSGAYGNYYGSPKSVADGLERGNSSIMILDRAGARVVAAQVPTAVLIWVTVPSLYILRERLDARGTDSAQTIERRMALAAAEIEDEEKRPIFHHHIVNDEREKALDALIAIVLGTLDKNLAGNAQKARSDRSMQDVQKSG